MTITADQIVEYLQDHLDFFEQHPKLVRELILPTDSGAAISLIEFQLRKLRDRIQQLERENDHMIETARINSVLFEKTRSLVLSLLDARDLDDLSVVLDEKLANGFDIPVVRLLLSDQFKIPDSLSLIQPVKAESLQDGGQLAQNIAHKQPHIGRLALKRRGVLFGDDANSITRFDTDTLQAAGEPRDALDQLIPGQSAIAINGSDGVGHLLTIALEWLCYAHRGSKLLWLGDW